MPKPEVHKYPVLPQANSWRNSHFMNEKNNDRDLEIEMMKMRFSKLLLGEDMSGSGKGVCTAVAVSNAITNLYATVFGHFWKLEPLPPEKKLMWKREMECLLCVCDYIVEFFPSSQTLQDGTVVEVMKSRPRSDIYMNLPALQKLDAMLLDIFDSFRDPEFWYLDERNPTKNARSFGSFRQVIQRKDEKWWMPIPCVPSCGLSEKWKTHLQNKRECANQILKAAMAINSSILAEMKVPEIYMDSLPKHGRAILGDAIHRYISTYHFSPKCLLDCLNVTSEHEALELADRIEASIYVWKRKSEPKISKSSWDVVKDFVIDGEKNEILLSRAESLLSALKKRYPGLSQTTLDTCKIQYNKDIGQSILESYSRVLESLSFNMVAWIEDVLAADKSIKHSSH